MATSPGVCQELPNKHSSSTDHQTDGTGVEPSDAWCSGADWRVSSGALVFEKQSPDLRRVVEYASHKIPF